MRTRAHAPGRVNLIGDHTDYMGGLVLPMAVDRGTTVVVERTGSRVVLESATEADPAVVDLDVADPAAVTPAWARFVAGAVLVTHPSVGAVGAIRSDLPIGAGLSSSSSLTVAVALALGLTGTAAEMAVACQRAETAATGVPGGIMDQLVALAAQPGAALLLDCHTMQYEPVAVPDAAEIVVAHSGQPRTLAGSAYAERRAQCEEAERRLGGPLRLAAVDDLNAIADPLLRRRARHVVTENRRVSSFATALRAGDLVTAGGLMDESHASLRDDFDVSTDALEATVAALRARPGVHGARLTGAGFGGCVVALADPGSPAEGWRFRPMGGATVTELG